MIVTIALQAGTSLPNVRYRFIVNGSEQSEQSSGITQPDANFPFFVFNCNPPPNTNEVIAYDRTNLANWNVAQLTAALQTVSPPVVIPPVLSASVTVPFRSVYESIMRRLGYNPRGDKIKEDVAQNVLLHINDRMRYIWSAWDWPQLNVVEWRAFRPVFVGGAIFHTGDDLYYFGDGVTPPQNTDQVMPSNWPGPNAGYYHCIATNPSGQLPTNPTYFTPYSALPYPLDRYIQYQQTGRNAIGDLLDVYKENPRLVRKAHILQSTPSSRGVDVHLTNNDIVWIRYRIPVSQFTLTPFLPGDTGVLTRYDPVQGDCFIVSVTIFNPGQQASFPAGGILIPFPAFLAGYVRPAAYADTLLETSNPAPSDKVTAALGEASEYLQMEIDKLSVQGQRFFYPTFPSRHKHHHFRPDTTSGAIPVEVFSGFN